MRTIVRRLPPRLGGGPVWAAARQNGGGFFGNLKENLKKEVEKNKDLQEALKGLREDETLKKAREAATAATAGFQRAAEQAGSSASSAAEQAGAKASEAAEQAAKLAAEAKAKAEASAAEAGFQRASQEEASGSASGGASGGEQPGAKSDGAPGEPSPPPLHERLVADVSAAFSAARERLGGAFGGGGAAGAAGAAADAPPADSGAVVVREPTFWEKATNFGSGSGFGWFGDAAGSVGDRIFGETEQAEALRELRELMPDFDMDKFLTEEVAQKQRDVLGAYLRGDMEALRRCCRDAAYGALHKSVMEREAHQLQMDERLLFLSDPEIESVRYIGGMPTPVVSFEAHQLNCVRSKSTKQIVEGDEDDIRAVHYLFALQPTEDWAEPEPEAAEEETAAAGRRITLPRRRAGGWPRCE